MDHTCAEGHVCSYCNRPYLAFPLPGGTRPPHPLCPALATHLVTSNPSPGYDEQNLGACMDCKRGDHDWCVDWFCWCTQSYGDGPCSLAKRRARALATGQPWHEPKYRDEASDG